MQLNRPEILQGLLATSALPFLPAEARAHELGPLRLILANRVPGTRICLANRAGHPIVVEDGAESYFLNDGRELTIGHEGPISRATVYGGN